MGTVTEAESFERLRRQIRRLIEIAPRTMSELLHFTGEDEAAIRRALEVEGIAEFAGLWGA